MLNLYVGKYAQQRLVAYAIHMSIFHKHKERYLYDPYCQLQNFSYIYLFVYFFENMPNLRILLE